ncbi:ROK family protein [Frankia sp. AgKG'84/4]|uniref:ROK family protein n=1 Tax=Frankia sp. AgKG'84/4 TaxID=573490 RepID=UPI002542D756
MPPGISAPASALLVRRSTGARQATLRESNLALVARIIQAHAVPPSRADVATAASMTRATVSRLVDELVAAGIVEEAARPAQPRRGRPATPLVPGSRLVALGLQVDVGFLAARVVNLRGEIVTEHVTPGDFVASDPAATLRRLGAVGTSLMSALPAGLRIIGAGLALPGIVSVEEGLLRRAPNLGWTDVRPARLLGERFLAGLPLTIGNEADLAAGTVAETAPGRPGPLTDFLYLSGGIGIGGAVVRAGRVAAGRHGWGGEIGHVCVDPAGPTCRCGSTGCLEQYAGRHALLAAAGLTDTTPSGQVRHHAAAGDPAALRAIATASGALAVALASVINVVDIPTVVLGGYLGQVLPWLRPDLEDQLRARVLSARWAPPRIVAADTGPAPGATGAAFVKLAAVINDPARWIELTGPTGHVG